MKSDFVNLVIHRRRRDRFLFRYNGYMVRYKKYVLGLFGIFFLVLLTLFFAPKARSWYGAWKDARFQDKVKSVRKEIYDAALRDTYGGKTPQETLAMYIEAVEKGDYELASKYFVEEKREEE